MKNQHPQKPSAGASRHWSRPCSRPPPSPSCSQAAGPSCAPSLNHFDRTQACWTDNLTILVYTQDGELVGEIHFVLIDSLHLRLTSRSFTENLTVDSVSPEGETPAPVSLDLRASCGSPCHATAHFAGVLRTGLSGTVSYDDSIGAGKSHSTRTKYVLDFSAPDFTELTPVVWNSPSQAYYRCDDMFSGQGAGCVFPNFAPTLTTMTNMKDIAANIRKAQAGPGHYGEPGKGHPLHYLANKKQQTKNYNAVCSRRAKGGPPRRARAVTSTPSRPPTREAPRSARETGAQRTYPSPSRTARVPT